MAIVERVKRLNLPLDQLVVIGSGILDALELREASDIDLVLSANLFAALAKLPDWQIATKRNELVLRRDDIEAFLSWGSQGRPNFEELYTAARGVGGVHFADPHFVINWKRQRASDKDLRDIALLEEYLAHE